jgi:hypothetical protein
MSAEKLLADAHALVARIEAVTSSMDQNAALFAVLVVQRRLSNKLGTDALQAAVRLAAMVEMVGTAMRAATKERG